VAGVDPQTVRSGVVGMAGAGSAGRAAAERAVREAWCSAGLQGRPTLLTDLEVAFAAGTPARDGVLLVAGTGAVAAAVRDGAVVRRADGYGWLLGDEGSAVWVGRAGIAAVLRALDGRAEPTALTEPVTAALLGRAGPADPAEHAQLLVGVTFDRPPAALGRLAPVVTRAAAEGDPVASRIVADAAALLLSTVDAVATSASGPVVLGGGLLLSDNVLGHLVRAGVRERFGREPLLARDGAAGAAVLALRLLDANAVDADLHARITAPAADPR
jgi:N-acetylglucosamine kinase-like BadF-type ATPase